MPLNVGFRSFFIIGLAVVLSGCGWHLQGSARLPASLAAIRIDTQDPYSDFYRELRASLMAAGAQVTTNLNTQDSQASAVVHVKADQTGQRLLSVSNVNRPVRYEVYYNVVYSVDVAGVETIPDQPMELATNYSYDATAVLAKQREQLNMQQALARELAGQAP